MGVAEGRAAGPMDTVVADDTEGMVPDGRLQAPHSSANPTAISFHFRQSMPGPSDDRHGTAAHSAIPVGL